MLEVLKAVLLGIVQGLTEFFPISSSAHLRVLREVLDFKVEGLQFDVAVHLATLLAVVIYFRREISALARGPHLVAMGGRLALASAPLFIVGYLAGSYRESLSLWVPVVCWLFSGTYLLLLRGRTGKRSYEGLTSIQTLAIGVAQSAAFFPGMSRSGSTIAVGIFLGLEREAAAKFSFLLAIPAILGATAYSMLKLLTNPKGTEGLALAVGVAMPVSFAVGLVAIHWLLQIIRGDRFHRFGWYNLCAAHLFALYLVIESRPA